MRPSPRRPIGRGCPQPEATGRLAGSSAGEQATAWITTSRSSRVRSVRLLRDLPPLVGGASGDRRAELLRRAAGGLRALHLVPPHEGWYALPERFDDQGVSGASMARSAPNQLLELAETGAVERVVVYSPDRIAHRLVDRAEMLALFERHGVKLSISKGELSESDLLTGQLAMDVLASLAGFERGLIRERLR